MQGSLILGLASRSPLGVNGGRVAFSWNTEQSDAARNRKDRTVIKRSSVIDVVPQQAGDNTVAPPSANSNTVARPMLALPPVAQAFILCSSPPNWPRLCNLSACSRALAARLSTLPHRFTFVFPARSRAGCA